MESHTASSSSSSSSSSSADEDEESDATDDADALLETAGPLSSSTDGLGQAVAAEVRAMPAEDAAEEAAGSDASAAGSDVESESGAGAAGEIKASGVSPDVLSPPNDAKSIRHWRRLASRGHALSRARVPTAARVVWKKSTRRRMWECAALTFHPDVLSEPWDHLSDEQKREQSEALRIVYDFWAPSLFQARSPESLSFKNPPPEMFEDIDFAAFEGQYTLLRAIVPELLKDTEGAQCWVVERVLVRIGSRVLPVRVESVAFEQDSLVGTMWGGEDMSIAFGSSSAVGRMVYVSLGGPIAKIQDRSKHCFLGEVVGFEKHVPEKALYKLLMSRDYEREVRPAGVWHVLRLYHRLVMAGQSTEALAELVGSLLTQRVQAQIGRHRALKHVIGAVMLRCFGIRGDTSDVGFLKRSLNIYFRGKPWHFVTRREEQVRRARLHPHMLGPSMALHRHRLKAGAKRKFSWLEGNLSEVAGACARKSLKLQGQNRTDLSTPYAGLALQSSGSSVEMHAKLSQACDAFEPARIDARLLGGLGAPCSAVGSERRTVS